MHGEEKGINKARKAVHLAMGGFQRWWWWEDVVSQRCRETSSKLSEERQSPSHPRAENAIQDYIDSSKAKRDTVRGGRCLQSPARLHARRLNRSSQCRKL